MGSGKKQGGTKAPWWKRFWRWLVQPIDPEEAATTPPPAPLPPKAEDYRPQGRIYRQLNAQRPLLAGNGAQKEPRLQVYDYCGVVFPKADQLYHYISTDPSLQVGDHVLVPVHVHGVTKDAEGIVVSIGQYLAPYVPYPLPETSYMIRKLSRGSVSPSGPERKDGLEDFGERMPAGREL